MAWAETIRVTKLDAISRHLGDAHRAGPGLLAAAESVESQAGAVYWICRRLMTVAELLDEAGRILGGR